MLIDSVGGGAVIATVGYVRQRVERVQRRDVDRSNWKTSTLFCFHIATLLLIITAECPFPDKCHPGGVWYVSYDAFDPNSCVLLIARNRVGLCASLPHMHAHHARTALLLSRRSSSHRVQRRGEHSANLRPFVSFRFSVFLFLSMCHNTLRTCLLTDRARSADSPTPPTLPATGRTTTDKKIHCTLSSRPCDRAQNCFRRHTRHTRTRTPTHARQHMTHTRIHTSKFFRPLPVSHTARHSDTRADTAFDAGADAKA